MPSPACGSAKVARSPTGKKEADDTPVGGANNRSLQGQMVALTRFAANHRGIVAIPKSVRQERMVENFAILDFQLDDEDLARIATLDRKASSFFDHRDPAKVDRKSTRLNSSQ